MAKTVQEQIDVIEKRIAADTAKLAELKASVNAATALASLKHGDSIQFVFGRAENRKTYTGEVRSVFDTDKGQRVKVLYGEGADEQIVTIDPTAIQSVGDGQPITDAAADPLANIN